MTNPVLEECCKPCLAHVRWNDDGLFAVHQLEGVFLMRVEMNGMSNNWQICNSGQQ